ncbi:MAG: ABC transporter permease subunit [Saccharofermentanales bacterium]|jgi:ribose/xylose/arabinose/galactoside ABC-type transport system permease subunit
MKRPTRLNSRRFSRGNPLTKNVPLLVAILLFILLFVIGSVAYQSKGFLSLQVIFNLLIDNSYLLIIALGENLVLIMGGIDLSVGAVMAFCNMIFSYMLTNMGVSVWLAIPVVLLTGIIFGVFHGYLITYKGFQPFIATLAGQFIARGACYIISVDTIQISNPGMIKASIWKLRMFGAHISLGALIALALVVVFQIISRRTKFGRNVYAVGGNELSARLMGLPVQKTKMQVYIVAGLMTAVGSLVFALYVLSAYGTHGDGMHLDAVSAAVIGGTITTGGAGEMVGTLFGVLIIGIIRTMITFQGNLNSWWSKIATAILLLLFILIQRLIITVRERARISKKVEIISDEADGGGASVPVPAPLRKP